MPIVAVFGGSQIEPESVDYELAVQVGQLLSEAGFGIATGGYYGIMEAALKGAFVSNSDCIGVTTNYFKNREKNKFVKTEIRTETYLNRLEKLIDIADGYIIFPGGTGTLLELAAVWTLRFRGVTNKPIACVGEQWQEVIQTMCFYSEKTIEEIPLLSHFEEAKDAADFIINQLKNNN